MFQLIGTSFTWVSNDSFLVYAKKIANLNWNSFSLDDLTKDEKIIAKNLKIRAYLRFFINLNLIYRLNSHYTIVENNPNVILFFKNLRENKGQEANEYLINIIKGIPFFQLILNNFLIDNQTHRVSELKEFLRDKDNNKRKIIYYSTGAKFFSKFLHNLKLIDYNQRIQTIKIIKKDQKTIKIPKETIKEIKEKNLISNYQINFVINGKKSKIFTSKDEIIKIILDLPEEIRKKILEEIL